MYIPRNWPTGDKDKFCKLEFPKCLSGRRLVAEQFSAESVYFSDYTEQI